LKWGADVHLVDQRGWSALIYASERGRTAIVKALLAHGADARVKDKNGIDASGWADVWGYHDIIDLLQNALAQGGALEVNKQEVQ
jgi:ankyrin repeat protein